MPLTIMQMAEYRKKECTRRWTHCFILNLRSTTYYEIVKKYSANLPSENIPSRSLLRNTVLHFTNNFKITQNAQVYFGIFQRFTTMISA